MFCRSCGNKLDDDALFCMSCGAKISDTVIAKYCAHCGTELEDNVVFCMSCGKKVQEEEMESEEKIETESAATAVLIETPQKETSEINPVEVEYEVAQNSPEMKKMFFIVAKDWKKFAAIRGGNPSDYYCPNCHIQVNSSSDSCTKCGASFYDWGKSKGLNDNAGETSEKLAENKKSNEMTGIHIFDVMKENSSSGKETTEDKTQSKIGYVFLIAVIFIVLALAGISRLPHNKESDKFKIGDIICTSSGTDVAVIFKAETDDSPALGVALTQSPPLQWASCHYWYESGYDKTTVAQGYDKTLKNLCDLDDGHDSYKILCNSVTDWKIKGNYPAFEYAENYVAGEFTEWYIPSARELYYLYTNLTAVNHSLEECGAKKIQTMLGSVFYWTCNQDKETSWAAVCTDFQQQIDSNQKIVKGGNQKGGYFIVLPIHQFSQK